MYHLYDLSKYENQGLNLALCDTQSESLPTPSSVVSPRLLHFFGPTSQLKFFFFFFFIKGTWQILYIPILSQLFSTFLVLQDLLQFLML